MLISVIIPTYNRADLIGKTIGSLLQQQYKDYEIIVVDDGSLDNTEEIVKAIDSGKVKYLKVINGERGAARNFGAFNATGDYVNFFDSDDLAYPNHLEVAAEFINSNKNVEVFHLGFDVKNAEGKMIAEQKDVRIQFLDGNPLSCNGVFINRDIFKSNLFVEDRDLAASEDFELWIRLDSKYSIQHVSAITSSIINHDERSVLNCNLEKLVLRKEKFFQYAFLHPEVQLKYGKSRNRLKSEWDSYISLHLVLAGRKHDAFKYLRKSMVDYPGVILRKRFYAIVKRLIG